MRERIFLMIDELKHTGTAVTDKTHLFDDLEMDSLSFMALLTRIEEEYGIEFRIEEIEECLLAGRLIELTQNKVEAGK